MKQSRSRPSVMDKLFIVRLAWRNLRSHRLRTGLTLVGIIIGISAIVFLLSFAYGIERLVTKEVSSGNALVLLDVGTGNSQIVKIDDGVIADIKNIAHVKNVHVLTGIAAKSDSNNKTLDIGFFGTDENFLSLSGISPKAGEYFSPTNKPEIIINTAYAKFLGSINDEDMVGKKISLDLIIPKELADSLEDVKVPKVEYTITGVFLDDSAAKAYTNILSLEKLGLKNFTQIKVEADRIDNVSAIRKQIESRGLQTQYVGDTIHQIDQVFTIFKAILSSFGLVTLIVSLLGMFNTLTISLLERMKEIALMKILGMRRRDISLVFLAESVILGLTGGILGIITGVVFARIANFILNLYATSSGGDPVSLFYFPVGFVALILLISFLIGLGTGWYPARRAMRINPLDVLRYE